MRVQGERECGSKVSVHFSPSVKTPLQESHAPSKFYPCPSQGEPLIVVFSLIPGMHSCTVCLPSPSPSPSPDPDHRFDQHDQFV